ncbi:MAG TPA: hypothetical protein VLF87_04035 [Patescibacteria group bacterium]|nr:hypothetical protein [Patescibacteria group bacterium]
MSDLTIDTLEMAKALQWEIEVVEDPMEAAFKATTAVDTIRRIDDLAFKEGSPIQLRAVGAYAFRYWVEDENRFVNMRFDYIAASGDSAGVSFIQNLTNPHLQTLFVGVRNPNILALGSPEDEVKLEATVVAPSLVVPVLDLEMIQLAA